MALVCVISACSSESMNQNTTRKKVEDPQLNNLKRSALDAIDIASKFGRLKSSITRGKELKVDEQSIAAIVSAHTRSASDTLIYAVNYTDNNGYLLISANKATEPILAIVEDGAYTEEEYIHSDSFSFFIKNAAAYVESASAMSALNQASNFSSSQGGGMEDFLMMWYDDTIKSQSWSGARVEVNWGQNWPENTYCPNKVAGCGPVAIAQVVSYFKPNLNFDLTFDNRHSDRLVIDWNQMLTHKKSTNIRYPESGEVELHVVNCNENYEIHNDLAAFVRQIGVWCYSDYNENSTSTDLSDLYYVASKLLSDYNKVNVTGSNCYDKIKSSGIVLMTGYCSEGGHAWVIDGVGNINYDIHRYYYYNPKTHQYKDSEIISQCSKYVHCNWGWAGQDNGYFLLGVYDTDKGIGTIEHHGSRYNFTESVYGYAYLP